MINRNFEKFLKLKWLIGLGCVLTYSINWLFWGDMSIPFIYAATGIIILMLFLVLYEFAVNRMVHLSEKVFVQRLFLISFIIRVIVVISLYFLFIYITGTPQHPDAVDAIGYHNLAIELSMQMHKGYFDPISLISGTMLGYDDIGFFSFMGILYSIFGHYYLVLRLFHCILGALTVYFSYKVLKIIWGHNTALYGSLLLSFFPSTLYYTGIHNKETFLLFLVFMFLYGTISTINLKKFRTKYFVLIFVSISGTVFTRMPLAVLMIITISSAIIFQKKNVRKLKSLFILILIMAAVILMMQEVGIYDESIEHVQRYVSVSEKGEFIVRGRSTDSYIKRGQNLAKFVAAPFMVALSLVSPFPSMVKTNIRFFNQTEHWYHFAGLFIWGLLSYFSIIGLINTIKQKFREASVLWVLTIGYTGMIGLALYGFSIRFNMIKIPLMLMFTIPGIQYAKLSDFKKWKLYIVAICMLILTWNYVKLAGRGLI